MGFWTLLALVASSIPVLAAPAPVATAGLAVRATGTPTLLSANAIASITPYSYYAAAGECVPASTLAWSCGPSCQANALFHPIASGGDGDTVQYWYVGYDPTLNTVIVGHQGTNTSEILPFIEDGDFFLTSPSTSLFPGLSSSIEMHNGFLEQQALTAASVLAAVTKAMSTYGTRTVTTVGHSLGAAISLLDAVSLSRRLPSGTTVKFFGYGLPRVGNPAFASYVDGSGIQVTHINNELDFVPILPGRFLGFAHPAGEVHIQSAGNWYACPGEDNTSSLCEVGAVPNIFEGDESDHDGPYGPVLLGSKAPCAN